MTPLSCVCLGLASVARAADTVVVDADVLEGRRADSLQQLRRLSSAGRGGADGAHHLSERAAVGARHQEQGCRARDAAVGREPGEHEDRQRSQPVAERHRDDRPLGGRRRAEGRRQGSAARADVPGRRLGVRAAGRGDRSAHRGAGAADGRVSADVVLREVAVPDRRVDSEDAGPHEQPGDRASCDAVHPPRCPKAPCIKDGRPVVEGRWDAQARRGTGINQAGLPPGSGPASGWCRTSPAADGKPTPTASRAGCRRAPTSR